jgi:predicted nucleic acid-binding protein
VIIISDTSVITNLAAIEQLHLLPQLYNQVIIPEAVYRELTEIELPVPGTIEIKNAPWVEIRQVVNRSIVQQLREQARLDIGESEAISLALELKADLLLIDERRGRMEANRLGLRITGLLGLLIEAKQRDLIIAVKPLIDTLITTSAFRVSSALYNQILEIVNELE